MSSVGFGHHNTSCTPYQGHNGQHTLSKDTAGIHAKNRPCTKNIKHTQATQGYFHLKIAL